MGGVRRVIDYLDEASEAWIGWRLPPPRRAVADAQWQPDAPDAYCERCGGSVGPGERREAGCAGCRDGSGIGDGVVRLGAHAEDLRDWILSIKYGQWAAMGDLLGRRLGEAVRASGKVELNKAVVVPMPMPWQRRLYRGIDHAKVIAGALAKQMEVPIVSALAKSNGPPLVSLTASERQAVGGRGMRLRRRWGGWPFEGLHVIVVDDVRTSGASMRAAIRLLRTRKPARVVAAVLAVADESGRRAVSEPKQPSESVESTS